MPRSNITGGKHHKKGKKHKGPVDIKQDNRIETAAMNQVYASIKKKVGGSRLLVECSDGKERSAIIPGKFFKKVWMNVGDIVLCDLNVGSDDSLCYISHKYTNKDANVLKSQGKFTFEIVEDKDDMGGFKYADGNSQTTKSSNNTNTIDNLDSDEEDDAFVIHNPNRKQQLGNKDEDSSQSKSNKENNDDSDSDSDSDVDINDL
ncbi:translation initiation factor 1a [Fadolivirus algeromassiliense]|jgi:translation initiation factor 1A|uniref:Translation initiation factor 1a n=1 Tax=Fadolivirus FV1/VV64 TaxID=3070911 RepID=A0A7D3V8K7_9VIRU|nr:translation initiation factor 1a [Fadolivirus algeromassiliense]QKF93677.1 translation initiation factor 1a [Fadolivirus FV1/VV64]